MRILHLYSGNLFGGVERVLLTLSKLQSDIPDLQHEYALCFNGKLSTELETIDAPTHILGQVKRRNPLSIWNARKKLANLLEKNSYEAVIMHSAWSYGLFASTIKSSTIKSIFWNHDVWKGSHWLELLVKIQNPRNIIVNSEYSKFKMRSLLTTSSNITVIPNPTIPIEQEKLKSKNNLCESLGIDSNKKLITILARIQKGKGHETLIKALEKINSSKNWHCIVAGAPSNESETKQLDGLKRQARESNISDRISFIGFCDTPYSLLCASDIHCQPNTAPDSFGMVFLEALFAGTPSITTTIGGQQELINNECGILIENSNITQLASALKTLISNDELCRELGENGRKRATEFFSPKMAIENLKEFITKV